MSHLPCPPGYEPLELPTDPALKDKPLSEIFPGKKLALIVPAEDVHVRTVQEFLSFKDKNTSVVFTENEETVSISRETIQKFADSNPEMLEIPLDEMIDIIIAYSQETR
jgi:hypothetical protein